MRAGFKLTLLFGLFSTFMIFFYTCNLRVNLIAVEREKPLLTFRDILNEGQRFYLPTDILAFSYEPTNISKFSVHCSNGYWIKGRY